MINLQGNLLVDRAALIGQRFKLGVFELDGNFKMPRYPYNEQIMRTMAIVCGCHKHNILEREFEIIDLLADISEEDKLTYNNDPSVYYAQYSKYDYISPKKGYIEKPLSISLIQGSAVQFSVCYSDCHPVSHEESGYIICIVIKRLSS